MLSFIANKIKNKKLLNFSLLTGVALLAAFLSIYPMFREGSLNRLLQNLFTDHIRTEAEFPAAICRDETISYEQLSSAAQEFSAMQERGENWGASLNLPVLQEQMILSCKGGSADSSFSTKSKMINLGCIPDPDKYTDVVYGVGTKEAGQSDSEIVKEALEAGAYPCVISQSAMDAGGMVVGEVLSFKYRLYDDEAPELSFVITGIIEEKEDDGYFWHHRLAGYEKMLFLSEDDFSAIITENEIAEITISEAALYDYTKIDSKSAAQCLSGLKQIEAQDPCCSDNFSALLGSYREQEKEITMILFTFELPIIALLLLFLYMVSGRILEMETTEIAMLKSRGVSRLKIIGVYVLQSAIIALFGCMVGLPGGFLLCRLAAGTNAFLVFTLKDVSTSTCTWMMLPFVLIAFLLAVLIMTRPVISLSKLTITDRKSLRIAINRKPAWERLFLDVVLLGVSAYLLYNYYKQRDTMSATIISG
ncbi:MAG: ABC transporter permease, partial [Lachnospiraceae bacterium]|nr:ABC transporter permease [Lachnospiraceae bacterium]